MPWLWSPSGVRWEPTSRQFSCRKSCGVGSLYDWTLIQSLKALAFLELEKLESDRPNLGDGDGIWNQSAQAKHDFGTAQELTCLQYCH